jgi:hypothetical protein
MDKGIYVYCQTRFIGFHNWPEAPHEVKYLRDKHRHEFHVKATVKVDHSNRDVEFITLRKVLDYYLRPLSDEQTDLNYRSMSCEMIADELIEHLKGKDYNVYSVEVSEDGENGAIVVCQ